MLSKILGVARKASDRQQGDRHRDAGDWSGAANAYIKHLETNRGDQPIWVQLGHAWKEQGLLNEAADAYETAVSLDPQDADANSHLADALRHLGRDEAALAAYERVIEAAPNLEALRQIRLLRRDPKVASAIGFGEGTIFLAIQDLFGYLKAHVTMSGIQRVQAGIAMHAINDPTVDVRFILSNVGGASPTLPDGEFWMVDNAQMMRVIAYASDERVDHETLRELLSACEDAAQRVRPLSGSTVILLGAFWGLGNGVRHFVRSKRDGVRIGAYVYDIIPVTHPEFCDDALVVDFTMAICELCAVADFIFTISDATRTALADFIAKNGGRSIPMATVPLAHHLTRETGGSAVWPKQLDRVRGRRYVAYVSTIEGRKNHLYVINAWRRLIAEGVDVPDLVFVGRLGWKIDALVDVLNATDNLGGRLHIAHNLSDGELNAIYAGCEFSVFTSFVEGWGLPVGESLFHGRPCVASDTSSIPEVGGDLVDYVDPFNLTQGIEVFRRMVTDPTYLRSRAKAIRDQFTARTWRDVGSNFMEKAKQYQAAPITPLEFLLREGATCSMATHPGVSVSIARYFHQPNRLILESEALYGEEDHGAWMQGSSPEIAIATDLALDASVLVYVRLSVSPGARNCRVRVRDQVSKQDAGVVALRYLGDAMPIRLPARIGEDGMLRLRFEILGSYTVPAGDTRDFAIGLRSIGFVRPHNVSARQELIETMTLHDVTT